MILQLPTRMPLLLESGSDSCAGAGADTPVRIEIPSSFLNQPQEKTPGVTPTDLNVAYVNVPGGNAADVNVAGFSGAASAETRCVSGGGSCDLSASVQETAAPEAIGSASVDNSVSEMRCCAAAAEAVDSEAVVPGGSPRGVKDVPRESCNGVSRPPGLVNCSSAGINELSSAAARAAVEEGSVAFVASRGAAVGGSITRTTTAYGSFGRCFPLAAAEETAESRFLTDVPLKKRDRQKAHEQQEEASSVGKCCCSDAGAASSSSSSSSSSSHSSTMSAVSAAVVRSAATQPTPFQLSRFILVTIHVLYVFTSARLLFGWPNLSNMLFRSGAFAWLCSDKESMPGPGNARYLCRAQDNAVQLLFTVGIASSFCCSLLAGIVMDWRGPRFCAVVGQMLNTAGWIFLGVASEHCQTYIAGVVCLALGADAGYLPSLTVSNLFPGHEGLVVVVMSAAMSASFSIPTLMDISWKQHPEALSFRIICLLYAGLGSGICAFIALLLFPRKPYVSQEELTTATSQEEEQEQRETQTQKEKIGEIKPQESRRDSEQKRKLQTAECKYGASSGFGDNLAVCYSSSTSAAWSRDAVVTGREGEVEKEEGKVEARGKMEEEAVVVSEAENRCSVVVNNEEKNGKTSHARVSSASVPFRRQLLSPYFICFFIYWPLNALFYNFYMTSAENMFNRDVNDLLGILGPLSMVPSVLLGKLADAYGVMSLVLFICSSAVGMYFFALFPVVWAYYVSAVFSCLYVSNFSGQMYAYMRDTFHTSNFGRVVGITSAAGGLLALLRIPLHDSFTLVVLKGNYRVVCGLMLGVTLFCLALAIKLFFVKRRKRKAYESDPCGVEKTANGKRKDEDTTADEEVPNTRKEKATCDV